MRILQASIGCNEYRRLLLVTQKNIAGEEKNCWKMFQI